MINPLRRSPLIAKFRAESRMSVGQTDILLASRFGFCLGVRRALVQVGQAWEKHSGPGRLFVLHEIIHNPTVCRWLHAQGLVSLDPSTPRWWADLREQDTVIVSAFGATVEEEAHLADAGVAVVATTCPSVTKVWRQVSIYARDGFTTVLHGRYDHPETQATLSRAEARGGPYVVVKDKAEAEELAQLIARGSGAMPEEKSLSQTTSAGFDPAHDLTRIGLANQTTMLAGESMEVAAILRHAMEIRYGSGHVENHFRTYGTICRATQQRQDAAAALAREQPDLVVVVGGHNSSNTRHLAELIATKGRVMHIEGPDAIESLRRVTYQPAGKNKKAHASIAWLKEHPKRRIGFTAGASTPDAELGETIAKLVWLLEEDLPEIMDDELRLSEKGYRC